MIGRQSSGGADQMRICADANDQRMRRGAVDVLFMDDETVHGSGGLMTLLTNLPPGAATPVRRQVEDLGAG